MVNAPFTWIDNHSRSLQSETLDPAIRSLCWTDKHRELPSPRRASDLDLEPRISRTRMARQD